MRSFTRSALAAAALAVMPQVAFAQQTTVGSRLEAIAQNLFGPFFFLIACGSFIGGLILLAVGLLKLTRQNESRGGIWESGLAHVIAAAMLISLPDAAGVGVMTVFGSATNAYGLSGIELGQDGAPNYMNSGGLAGNIWTAFANVGSVENCLSSEAPSACMAKNIAVNAVPMATWVLFGFSMLIGIFMFASAILDITKTQGGQGMPKGWAGKVVLSVLLINSAALFTYATQTVLGRNDGPINQNGLNASSSMLSYPVNSSIAIIQKYAELIGWCFTILAFFGAWAFVRGIFHLKTVADGRGNEGMGKGMVYIVAGILLANAKYSACVVLTTMGGSDMAAGFCSN